jgi:HD-like signal output (HDOD) protein
MPRRRILFVDDEQNVLDGLRTSLRRQRATWDMVFAGSGEEALALLDQTPFDVVVSDLRMPGTDGVALLRAVKGRHPGVARIILSGNVEAGAALQIASVAHQVLGKPCVTEYLRQCIDRTCELQALLANPEIRALVGRLDLVPSIARTYLALTLAIDGESAGAAELGRIVETDTAMSAKVLQMANSGFFAGTRRRVSIASAVTFLGVELLRTLALSAQVFSALDAEVAREFALEALQASSLRTAVLARRFVGDPARVEEAFTAGLVQDIGRVVLAVGLAGRYRQVLRSVAASGWPLHVVEKEELGVNHAEVGASLLGVWGLPFSLVEVVAYHHDPGAAQRHEARLVSAVHVAQALAAEDHGAEDEGLATGVDTASLERAGFLGELPRWTAEAKDDPAAQ